MQYDFRRVYAIHGTVNYDHYVTEGYAVRDRHERNRHLGYVAKVGKDWKAVRPVRFASFGAFHQERKNLSGAFSTRFEAAEYLRRLAAAFDNRAIPTASTYAAQNV